MRYGLASLFCCAALGYMVPSARAESMTEVNFMDQQANAGGYVTRFLVTERYLRMDFGQDRDDYVLFDRRENVVYNVTHEQRQIFLIEPGEVTVPKPEKWSVDEDMLADERGKRTFDIAVNGTRCSRITASPTFLPEVAQALGAFNELMRATQAATYLVTPPEMRHPCELARYILEPKRWLQNGLPLHEANVDGSIRRLLNYQTGVPVRLGLFAPPDAYRTIRMRDMQGRGDAAP